MNKVKNFIMENFDTYKIHGGNYVCIGVIPKTYLGYSINNALTFYYMFINIKKRFQFEPESTHDICKMFCEFAGISIDHTFIESFIMEHLNIESAKYENYVPNFRFSPKDEIGELCLLTHHLPHYEIIEVLKKYYNIDVPILYMVTLIMDLYEKQNDN